MTCLVGHPSIKATPPATRTSRHHLANRHLAGDRLLRIAHPLTPTSVQDTPPSKYWTATLTPIDTTDPFTGQRSAFCQPLAPEWEPTPWCQIHIFWHLLPFMYIQYRIDRCEALGNCIDASIIMEVFSCTSISVCIHCFFAIYPKLLNFTFVAFIPQEYLPFTFKPFHHDPYQDLYHQDSFAESYRNERPYERRYNRSCSCRCCYRRTYHRNDEQSCRCRYYYDQYCRTYDRCRPCSCWLVRRTSDYRRLEGPTPCSSSRFERRKEACCEAYQAQA